MSEVAYIITKRDGNIGLVYNGRSYSVPSSHANYSQIRKALAAQNYENLGNLLDVPKAINVAMKGTVQVRNGQVFYGELPMHNTVTERILDFIREGLPTKPLLLFLENLMANPMPMAVSELYDFLEHRGFPITEDGCFIGYKGVREDWKDRHSGTVSNTIGTIVEMPREQVDPDRRNECSYGYHVGTLEYAKGFAARTLLVKVNPRDCVAVPKDHDCSKLRVCRYEVLSEAQGLIETPMHPMPEVASDGEEISINQFDIGFSEGLLAYHDGLNLSDNPYSYMTYEAEGWAEGWQEAKADVVTPLNIQMSLGSPQTTKRTDCSHCGAKVKKRHADNCNRPRK